MINKRELLVIDLIKESSSISEVCRKLNICVTNGNFITIKNIITKYDIDVSHFKRIANHESIKKIPTEEILVSNSSYPSTRLKERLFNEGYKERVCEICGISDWMNQKIVLQLHHKDGNRWNNLLENVQILCPNCHSMTDNYSGKNIKKNEISNNEVEKISKKNKPKKVSKNGEYSENFEKLYGVNYELINEKSKKSKSLTELCISLKITEKVLKVFLKKINKFDEIKDNVNANKITIEKKDLEKLILEKSFLEIGRMYNITDNAVRKWCKKYGLLFRKKDIKKIK